MLLAPLAQTSDQPEFLFVPECSHTDCPKLMNTSLARPWEA